jgi:ABC-2 type transport system permease protein
LSAVRASFRLALRQGARTAAIVSVGLGLFYWVIMASSAGFASDAAHLPKILIHPPRALTALVGGMTDFVSARGWLATGMFHPVVLSLQTIGAFLVASSSGATELERGTLDLVLARPVRRASYLGARAAAGLLILTIVELGGLAGALASRKLVRSAAALPVGSILRAFAGSWILFAAFGAITLWIFARSHLRSRALGASVGVVVAAFFVNFVALLFGSVEWLRFVTPFHYFRAGELLTGGGGLGMLVLAGIAIAFAALALWEFARRDLTR